LFLGPESKSVSLAYSLFSKKTKDLNLSYQPLDGSGQKNRCPSFCAEYCTYPFIHFCPITEWFESTQWLVFMPSLTPTVTLVHAMAVVQCPRHYPTTVTYVLNVIAGPISFFSYDQESMPCFLHARTKLHYIGETGVIWYGVRCSFLIYLIKIKIELILR
jgi:hypothetical protein